MRSARNITLSVALFCASIMAWEAVVRGFEIPPFQMIWRSLAVSERIRLTRSSSAPFVMAGLDVAMIFALMGAIVAEFIGAQKGLGMLIQSMNFNMDVSGQFSILLILSVVGLLLNRGVMMIRKRVLFWDPSEKERIEQERVSA